MRSAGAIAQAIRRQRGRSLEIVAAIAGLRPLRLRQIERGDPSSRDEVRRLARALSVGEEA